MTTESNHTPIHNGLLFDGVRFWPGQQSPNICVLLRMTLQLVFLYRVVWFICHTYQLYEMMRMTAKLIISELTLFIIMIIHTLIKMIKMVSGISDEFCPAP